MPFDHAEILNGLQEYALLGGAYYLRMEICIFCKEREASMKLRKKKGAILALLLAALLAGGCRSTEKREPSSSAEPSSLPEVSQPEASASGSEPAVNPPRTEAPSSEPASSQEDAPVNAVPEQIHVDGVEFPELSQYDSSQVTWGPGRQMDGENRPVACVGLQEQYGDKDALFLMPAGEKSIYLTFDEGYENGYTAQILDVLKEKDCPAVFFVTHDYVSRNPELVQRMVDEGHAVGNHSMHHPNMTTVDPQTAANEIADLHNCVAEQFSFQMTLFRPPEGAFSERSLVIAQALGYRTTLWSFAYADWNPDSQPEPGEALERITGAAHEGAIYLLHAVSSTNTQILPAFIDTLREEGYTFLRLE